MYLFLIILISGIFLTLLIVNLYFRIIVYKHYRKLVQNEVEFRTRDILNPAILEEQVIPRYPHMAEHIRGFSSGIRKSMRIAMILIVLITLFSGILMYYR